MSDVENPQEFEEFPKIARLSRDCVITEKLDGTNAQVFITTDGTILTGSRTQWITPEKDNHGFAKWVAENKDEILTLGPGRHYGEWWGSGIQRGYGLTKGEKRFSLFNTHRWALHGTKPKLLTREDDPAPRYQEMLPPCVGLVPVLYEGLFSTDACYAAVEDLRINGSKAAPGFMNPEGIVCFHQAAYVGFKKTLKDDNVPKSVADALAQKEYAKRATS
jgi:hypothetical protein